MTKILLIDDDPLILEALSITLESAGYSVQTAKNGVDGLQMIRDGDFDLVITDIIMPEKEGLEVISHLKREHPSVKVIAISGGGRGSSTTYLSIADAMGVNCTLAKPFSASELISTVEHLVN